MSIAAAVAPGGSRTPASSRTRASSMSMMSPSTLRGGNGMDGTGYRSSLLFSTERADAAHRSAPLSSSPSLSLYQPRVGLRRGSDDDEDDDLVVFDAPDEGLDDETPMTITLAPVVLPRSRRNSLSGASGSSAIVLPSDSDADANDEARRASGSGAPQGALTHSGSPSRRLQSSDGADGATRERSSVVIGEFEQPSAAALVSGPLSSMQQHLLRTQAQLSASSGSASLLLRAAAASGPTSATAQRSPVAEIVILGGSGASSGDSAAQQAVFRSPALFNALLSFFSLPQSVPLARVCRAWRSHTQHATRRAAVTQSPLGGRFAATAF